jgi:hypothetical protein
MRIERFSFHSKSFEWKLAPVSFFDLTLLVGVSGVGKTQILRAILSVKRIANGKPVNGAAWDIDFRTKDGAQYSWKGEYENVETFADPDYEFFDDEEEPTSRERPKILSEKLTMDGKEILSRTPDGMKLLGAPTPKLSPHTSALNLLSREDAIAPASQAFHRILHSDQSVSHRAYRVMDFSRFEKLVSRYDTLEKIQESELDTQLKLALVARAQPGVFQEIRDRFVDVFPNVEEVKVEPREEENAPFFVAEIPIIQIKERGVTRWIEQGKISSGMLRTILHIAEMYLWPPGTVVLIDEFENSLGINCIDILTEDLLQQNRKLQFIVTSHHPYIINNISWKYWKVVRRHGGDVYTEDADTLALEGSSHEAFIQLINSEGYREGIAVQ